MDNEKKILFEELTVPSGQYNQTDHNPSGLSQTPKKMNLMDLLDVQRRAKQSMTKAPSVTPYPFTNNLIEQIGDVYIQAAKIQSELGQSYQNPLISDNEKPAKSIKNIYKKMQKIKLIIKSVAQDMKELDIE